MGIVNKLLAECELEDNTECRIERNQGGKIHIHIGKMRIDMTKKELDHFIDVVVEGRDELIEIKDIETEE